VRPGAVGRWRRRPGRRHRRAEALCADVTAIDQVEEMVERCLADFGALHIAVNNAGIHGDPANPPVADYPLEWWDRVLATNLSSVFYCMRAEIRAMRDSGQGGSVINMASILGRSRFPAWPDTSPQSMGSLD
jgi:NAD(P)-dependent dehydrogenase (short-subunit alcohol dehydrogenase family)